MRLIKKTGRRMLVILWLSIPDNERYWNVWNFFWYKYAATANWDLLTAHYKTESWRLIQRRKKDNKKYDVSLIAKPVWYELCLLSLTLFISRNLIFPLILFDFRYASLIEKSTDNILYARWGLGVFYCWGWLIFGSTLRWRDCILIGKIGSIAM